MCTEIPTATYAGDAAGIAREKRPSKSIAANFLIGIFESSQNSVAPIGYGAAKGDAVPCYLGVKHRERREVAA
jgi:hypothetical protein